MRGARLDGALLEGADLRDAELAGASLAGCRATGARFDRSHGVLLSAPGLVATEASFVGAEWFGAVLTGARLDGARANGARFDRALAVGLSATRATLDRAVFDGAELEGAEFTGASARRAAFKDARGRPSFRGCDLYGSDLRGLPLLELPLDGASLEAASVDGRLSTRGRLLLESLGWTPSRWSTLPGQLLALALTLGALAKRLTLATRDALDRWRAERERAEADEESEEADAEAAEVEQIQPRAPGLTTETEPEARRPETEHRAPSPETEHRAPRTEPEPREPRSETEVLSPSPEIALRQPSPAPEAEPTVDDDAEPDDDPGFAWAAFQRDRNLAEGAERRDLAARLLAVEARARRSVSPARAGPAIPAPLRPARLWRTAQGLWREPDDAPVTSLARTEVFELFEEATHDRVQRATHLAAASELGARVRARRLRAAALRRAGEVQHQREVSERSLRARQAERAHIAREEALASELAPPVALDETGLVGEEPVAIPAPPAAEVPAVALPAAATGLPALLQRLDTWARAEAGAPAPAAHPSQDPELIEAAGRLRARSRAFFDEISERLPYALQVVDGAVRVVADRLNTALSRGIGAIARRAGSGSRSLVDLLARALTLLGRGMRWLARALTFGLARVAWAGVRGLALGVAWLARWAARAVVALGLAMAAGLRLGARLAARLAVATGRRARSGVVEGSKTTARALATGGRLGARGLARGSVEGWRWLVGDEAADIAPTLEESLDFAADASGREDTFRADDAARLLAARRKVRERIARRNTMTARAREVGAARQAELDGRAGRRDHTAVVRARTAVSALAAREARATAAAERQVEAATRRALAEEARRAQVAREAEKRRQREETVLAALSAEARDTEARLARLEVEASRDAVDPGLLAEQRQRAAEKRAAYEAQSQRVVDARSAAAEAGREAGQERRRLLLAQLRAGVGGLGRLRRALPSAEPIEAAPGVDLSGRALDERDLAGADLRGAKLVGASLLGADLRLADLSGADLTEADLSHARLDGARLDGAILDGATLDQVSLERASIDGLRARGARVGTLRGVDPALRARLMAAGAQPLHGDDGRGGRGVLVGLGVAAALVGGVYVIGRFGAIENFDAGALEQAATEAKQTGDAGAAVEAFEKLAAGAERSDSKVDYLLEAAASAEEAADRARALDLYDAAVAAAEESTDAVRARLARAEAWLRLELDDTAATEFRALLQRSDLTPDQVASSIVGLSRAAREAGAAEARDAQIDRLEGAGTDPERGSLAYALADAWAALDDGASARQALEDALERVKDPFIVRQVRVRLARAYAEDEQIDHALGIYRELMAEDGGNDARLGAAELLLRTGRDSEASTILAPLYADDDHDIRARALRARAVVAERAGNLDLALSSIRAILDLDGVPVEVLDEARVVLARLDPSAVEALVAGNPALRSELMLGRARALYEKGERSDARALWVELAESPDTDTAARTEAMVALADLQLEDNDVEGAVRRFDELLATEMPRDLRDRVTLGRNNALLRGGRIQEAEAAYLALREKGNDDLAAQCELGLARAAELRGQAARASELYLKVGRTSGPWAMEALLSLGELRARAGDFTGAVEAYRLARSRPGDASRKTTVDIALAAALADSGDDKAAAEIYATLLSASVAEVRVMARLAVATQKLAQDPAGARALLDEALSEAVPGESRNLARAQWTAATVALGEVDEAHARLAAWLDTESDQGAREEVAAAAMRAMREAGRPDAAAALAERYAGAGFEATMEAALSLREAGKPAEAARLLRNITAPNREDDRWRRELLADALIDADELDEADEVWASIGAGAADEAARFGRARVARAKGDYETALRLLEGNSDARAPEERGLSLEGLGRYEEAGAAYEILAAGATAEMQTAGRVGQARVRLAQDDAPGALAALAKLAVIDPGYMLTVAQIRGEALIATGRVDEARDVYAALDADAEQRTVGLLGQAECALAADDAKGALSFFDRAEKGSADRYYQAHAIAGLARAWAELGFPAKARAELERLRSGYPEREDAIERAAVAAGG